MRDDFAVFILSHGRAGRIDTLKSLERSGYTGKWYIVIDDEDEQIKDYINEYGRDKVIIFSKDEVAEYTDRGDNFNHRKIILYARNKVFDIAKEVGVKYFMQLDDDYTSFEFKFNDKFEYEYSKVENLDLVLESMIKFLNKSDATTIAFAQGGDFIGGKDSSFADGIKIKRKAMNTFLCDVDKPFKFSGSLNEDVTGYVRLQQLGKLMFTVNIIMIVPRQTQSNEGGITELYLDFGTYVKSMYSIMYNPSCIVLRRMGNKHKRIHHSIKWKNAVPKIINDKYKK